MTMDGFTVCLWVAVLFLAVFAGVAAVSHVLDESWVEEDEVAREWGRMGTFWGGLPVPPIIRRTQAQPAPVHTTVVLEAYLVEPAQ